MTTSQKHKFEEKIPTIPLRVLFGDEKSIFVKRSTHVNVESFKRNGRRSKRVETVENKFGKEKVKGGWINAQCIKRWFRFQLFIRKWQTGWAWLCPTYDFVSDAREHLQIADASPMRHKCNQRQKNLHGTNRWHILYACTSGQRWKSNTIVVMR